MTLADRLQACHSSVVHDVMKDMGLPVRVLPRTILGLETHMKAAGPVFTIRGQAMPPGQRPDPRYRQMDMLDAIFPGAVVVIGPKPLAFSAPCETAFEPFSVPWPTA